MVDILSPVDPEDPLNDLLSHQMGFLHQLIPLLINEIEVLLIESPIVLVVTEVHIQNQSANHTVPVLSEEIDIENILFA